jgi:hypothetical protein
MSDHPAPTPKPTIVVPDIGARISGPGVVDDDVLDAALAVACPVHQVPAHIECPLVGACLARQSIAPEVL